MKVEASSIEDYFSKAGERESMLRELDELIQKAAPKMKRELFEGMSITMIAYGKMPYKTKSGSSGEWPIIALANQKNYVSVYVCVVKDGEYIPELYKKELGEKVSIGKSCIRFNKLEKINLKALKNAVSDAAKLQADNKNEFGS